eukprot:966203_1
MILRMTFMKHTIMKKKSWQKVTFERKVFQYEDGNSIDVMDAPNAQPLYVVLDVDINCPSIIFIVLPDDTTERYGLAKLVCQGDHGIPSQMIVGSKFANHRNRDQYCSNVAIKVNAKLSNIGNKAKAWATSPGDLRNVGKEGITWVKEINTMVLGISLSNSIGA